MASGLALVFALVASRGAIAFSSGGGSCLSPAAGVAFHGVGNAGTGGFSLAATEGGQEVAEVLPGETVQLTLERGGLSYKGFLIRVNEGDSTGAAVGGLALTNPERQTLVSTCALPDTVATQRSDGSLSPLIRSSDVLEWTAPEGLAPGTTIVVSAFPMVEMTEWYGGGEPIQVPLTIAELAIPVPAMGPLGRIALCILLALGATRRRAAG